MNREGYEAAIAALQDRVEILELVARYNSAADDLDAAAWVNTFVDEGVFEIGAFATTGRKALLELATARQYGSVHITTNPLVSLDGDRATHGCTFLLGERSSDRQAFSMVASGRYTDKLVRTAAGWRFARRHVDMDVTGEAIARIRAGRS